MILAGTGHRPQKLGGFNIPNQTYINVCQQIKQILINQKPDKVISGLALGFDQWFAYIAYSLNIPFIAAVPFIGQESVWNDKSKKIYKNLLNKAADVVIVSEGGYSNEKLQIRNEYMVDHCDKLIACWDGKPSGTANCVNYAKSKSKEILLINPLYSV